MNLINATTMFMLIKFISMQHNSKLLFKLANSILGRKQTSSYPDFSPYLAIKLKTYKYYRMR